MNPLINAIEPTYFFCYPFFKIMLSNDKVLKMIFFVMNPSINAVEPKYIFCPFFKILLDDKVVKMIFFNNGIFLNLNSIESHWIIP